MNFLKLIRAALFSTLFLKAVEDEGGAPAPDYGNEFTPDGEDAPAAEPAAAAPSEEPPAAAAEPAAAESAPAPEEKPTPMIPKARLDEVLAKNKELQAQLNARQEQQSQAQTAEGLQELETKIDGLQERYEAAVMDGDSELAKQLRGEIRTTQQQYNAAFAQHTQSQTIAQMNAQAAWERTLAKVETDYPALNEDSDQFNPEMAGEVVELMNAYRTTGLSAHDALAKAVRMVVGAAQAAPAAQAEPAKTPEQVAQEAAQAKIAAAEAKAAERKAGAVAKNVAAAAATPPSLHEMGRDSDTAGAHRVSEMSEREFAALRKDEAALARARGDLV